MRTRTCLSLLVCGILAIAASGCSFRNSSASSKQVYSQSSSVAYAPPPIETGGAPLLTDTTFESEIASGSGMALVDFNAHWCGPCRKMSPIIDALAGEMASEAKIAKLDVDISNQTADKFDVHAIPCMIVFKDGKEVDRHYGIHSKDEVIGWIHSHAEKSVSLAQ